LVGFFVPQFQGACIVAPRDGVCGLIYVTAVIIDLRLQSGGGATLAGRLCGVEGSLAGASHNDVLLNNLRQGSGRDFSKK
jgi:hypothetical protein